SACRYAAVGNEPFLKSYNDSFTNITFPALKNIQNALNEAGIGDVIKATVPLNGDVYDSPASNPVPSAGEFRADIRDLMAQIVEFFGLNGAPFTVNIYPFLSLYGNSDFPIDFAFFDGTSAPVVDNGVAYTNVFDANFDTLVSALRKAGFGDLPIVVGEVGWPTDGDVNANVAMAERFFGGLLKHLAVDEDAKSVAPGNFERHWGLFTYDGRPKFAVDFSGQGQNGMPVGAKGVQYLPTRWCALNPAATDLGKLADNVNFACTYADCTALGGGCSCDALDASGKASYAFNAYFQAQSQNEESCYFQGLAMVTTQNNSQGSCNFTIQIASSAASTSRQARLVVLLLAIAAELLM
ncbi:glucan endo-1-3-beta-glucosidase, partial [Musa troglodytarum]